MPKQNPEDFEDPEIDQIDPLKDQFRLVPEVLNKSSAKIKLQAST